MSAPPSMVIGGNVVVNGQFDIWQNTTSTSLEGWLTADHWVNTIAGLATQTVSRQSFTVGQTVVPGEPRYYLRAQAVGGGTADSLSRVSHHIEDVRTFANATVTVDFWARRSSGAGNLKVYLQQAFGSGGSTAVSLDPDEVVLTTGWDRYSIIIDVPSLEGKIIGSDRRDGLQLHFLTSQATAFDQTIGVDLANVQITQSHGRLLYRRRTVAEELRLCQQRFCKTFRPATVPAAGVGINTGEYVYLASHAGAVPQPSPTIYFPAPMRLIPTILFYNPATAGSSGARDITAGVDCNTATAINVSEMGFSLTSTGHPSTAVGNELRIHWTATAI